MSADKILKKIYTIEKNGKIKKWYFRCYIQPKITVSSKNRPSAYEFKRRYNIYDEHKTFYRTWREAFFKKMKQRVENGKIKILRKKHFQNWEAIKVEKSNTMFIALCGGDTETRKINDSTALISLKHRGLLNSEALYNFKSHGVAYFETVLLVGIDGSGEISDVGADIVEALEGTSDVPF